MIDYPDEYARADRDVDYYIGLICELKGYVKNLQIELSDAKAGGDVIAKLHTEKASLVEHIRLVQVQSDEWSRKYNDLVDETTLRGHNQGKGTEDAVAQYKQLLNTYKKLYQDAIAELDKKS